MRSGNDRGIVGFIDSDDVDTDEIGAALQTFLGRFQSSTASETAFVTHRFLHRLRPRCRAK